jgi:glycosyltransferase involved in cell wall biosynthesis
MEKVPEWLTKPHLVLIDNSTDESAVIGNKAIAEKYNFEYIKMDKNTGICGGRQKAADHFHESDADFYLFHEDDMCINPPELEGQFCRNGFRKYIPNLYDIIHKIMLKENFDFLKMSFTEVYFDNDKALPWYNVPQNIRTRDWPEYDKLPITGLDPNSPLAKYNHINVCDGVAYINGEINYCNWPMIVSKDGNKKMFIDTKWANPYEQTWSSFIYQLEKEGKINAGLLLASPIWHERIKYYQPEERREN